MSDFEPVRVTPCQNCAHPMRQYNPDSEMMICEACGTRTDDGIPPPTKPQAPLNPMFKLHATFQLDGERWQVIGCQSYAGSVREWDDEDDAWEETPWQYHTWWVLNDKREIGWIVQDKEGYSWSKKTKVKQGIPEGDIRYEVGDWYLINAVGEFSYTPSLSERVSSYARDGQSLEIILDEQGQPAEIEAFFERRIPSMSLLGGFGKQAALDGLKRIQALMYTAIAGIFMLVVGYFTLQTQESSLMSFDKTQIRTNQIKQEIPLGKFELDSPSTVAFKIRGFLPGGDGNFDASFIVKDSDKTLISEIDVSLWRESGTDSDGRWTESQRSNSPRLRLPAGKDYFLSLKPDKFQRWKHINVEGQLTRNVVSLLPIIIGVALTALLAFIMHLRHKSVLRRETGVGVL